MSDLRVEIDGADYTSLVDWEETSFEEQADEGAVGQGTLVLRDITAALTPRFGQTVSLFDQGQLAWKGSIGADERGRDETVDHYGVRREYSISILDRNTLFDHRLVDGSNRSSESDHTRVRSYTNSYRSNVDQITYVISAGNVTMDAYQYNDSMYRDVVADCAEASGKDYWIDRLDRLHYLTDAQAANWTASWNLTDTVSLFASNIKQTPIPTNFNVGLITRNLDPNAIPLQNVVKVKYTEKDPPEEVVVQDNASIVKYGRLEGVPVYDQRARTRASAVERANAILTRSKEPEASYTTTIALPRLDILYAGQYVNVTSAHQGLSGTILKIANWSARRKGTAGQGYWEVTLNLNKPRRSAKRPMGYKGDTRLVPARPTGTTTSVYAILYGPNNEIFKQYPHIVWGGDGDNYPSGYASAPKVGPVEYVDKKGSVNQDLRWGIRVNGSGTVTVSFEASLAAVLRAGSWTTEFVIKKNGTNIWQQVTPWTCPSTGVALCRMSDTANVTIPGVSVSPGDLFTAEAFWSYPGGPVLVPHSAMQGHLEINGSVTNLVYSTVPRIAQEIDEGTVQTSTGSNFTTNYAYIPGTLEVYAEGVRVPVAESNPSNGSFHTFTVLPENTRFQLQYQVAEPTQVGSNPVIGPYTPQLPYTLLGTGGDGLGGHVLHDDGTWKSATSNAYEASGDCGCGPDTEEDRALLTTATIPESASTLVELNQTYGTMSSGDTGSGPSPATPSNANDNVHDSQSVRSAFVQAGPGTVDWWWATDLASAYLVSRIEIYHPNRSNSWLLDFTTYIEYSDNGSTWTSTPHTYSASTYVSNGPLYGGTHPVSIYTVDSPSVHRYWRIRKDHYAAGLWFLDADGMSEMKVYGYVVTSFSYVDAPNVVDADNDTYEAVVGGLASDMVRLDLGLEWELAKSVLRIAFEDAGALHYTIYGANDADYGDEVALVAFTVDATGGYIPQTITTLWVPTDPYRYYRLVGSSVDMRVHTWSLYQKLGDVIYVENPVTDEIAELQDALDAMAAAASVVTVDVDEHAHAVGEKQIGDGTTTTFYLAQEFEPGTVAAYAGGMRVEFAEGANYDSVTFISPPGLLATVLFDYLPLLT